jgi:hypothetical protein
LPSFEVDNERETTVNPLHISPRVQLGSQVSDEEDSSDTELRAIRAMEGELDTRLQDMREERHQHENRMSALHNACAESLSLSGIFTFPTFRGDELEDVNEFIAKYIRAADFCGWNHEKQVQALPLYLKGNAFIWFNSLPNKNTMLLEELVNALTNQFASNASHWRLRQNLEQRRQKPNEKLSVYTADIRQQCSRLDLPNTEWLHHFVKGLRPDIKDYVVLQQHDTFEPAENLARLKESVSPMPVVSNTIDTKQMTQDIIQQLKGLVVQPEQAASIAVVGRRSLQDSSSFNNFSNDFSFPQPPSSQLQYQKQSLSRNDDMR